MLKLFQKNKSFKNIRILVFATKYFQKITGYKNILIGGLPDQVLEEIKWTSQKTSHKKLPLTTKQLHRRYKIFGGKNMKQKN